MPPQEAVGRFDFAELVKRFESFDAPGAPVYSVADLVDDPHFAARGNIVSVHDEELNADLRMQSVMGRLSDTPGSIDHAGPKLGADNRAVLVDELGFDEETLAGAGLQV